MCGYFNFILKNWFIYIISFRIFDKEFTIIIQHKEYKYVFIQYYFHSIIYSFYNWFIQNIICVFVKINMIIIYYIWVQLFTLMSLNINLQTDRKFLWPWSPPTTISIVEIELLSDLLEHSWQYKLSSDVVKFFGNR